MNACICVCAYVFVDDPMRRFVIEPSSTSEELAPWCAHVNTM